MTRATSKIPRSCIGASDSTERWLGFRLGDPCLRRGWDQTRWNLDSLEFYTSTVDNAHSTFVARPRDHCHDIVLRVSRKTDITLASFVADLDDTFTLE